MLFFIGTIPYQIKYVKRIDIYITVSVIDVYLLQVLIPTKFKNYFGQFLNRKQLNWRYLNLYNFLNT